MTSYNPEIVAQFVYDTLTADTDITALVTGIYTYTLQGTAPPYLVIEINSTRPFNTSTTEGMDIHFTISCYSVEAGYSEVFAILEKVHAALQSKTATLTGYQVINTRLLDSNHKRLKDGNGIESALEFRSTIQEL